MIDQPTLRPYQAAADELLALRDVGVAVSGSFKAELYDRGGGAKISTLFADRVMSARKQPRGRPDKGGEPLSVSP